jgi:hypothetical protein
MSAYDKRHKVRKRLIKSRLSSLYRRGALLDLLGVEVDADGVPNEQLHDTGRVNASS